MTNLSIGDDSFRVEVEGDATNPALLLSHALGADLGLWEAQMPALLKAFRVIRYDSRGHGGSTTSEKAFSIARLGRDVLGILDALEIDTVHFLGVSMGGAVGQWLLVHAPRRIERAVLANTTAKFGSPAIWNERIADVLDKGMAAIVDGTMERWFSPTFAAHAPEKVAAIRAMLENGSPEGYAACCAALRDLDLREALRGISAPVLVVSGRDDASIGDEATRHLVETIPGAKHLVLDARHMSNVEADAAFSRAVVGFLTAKGTAGKSAVDAKRASTGAPAAGLRPAKTASRRVGTRRSTAARLPLGAMAKAQAIKGSVVKPTPEKANEVAGAKGRVAKEKVAKGNLARDKNARAEALPSKTSATKVPAAMPGKTEPGKITSDKTKPGKIKSDKATLAKVATRSTAAAAAKASTATTKKTKAAPAKSAKRPSAKSLKAMAANPPKARATKTLAPKTSAVAAVSPKAARGAKKAAPMLKSKAAPAGKAGAKPGRAIAAKSAVSKTAPVKTAAAKTAPSKWAPSKSAPVKSAKAGPRAKSEAAPRAKASKPGRRAS